MKIRLSLFLFLFPIVLLIIRVALVISLVHLGILSLFPLKKSIR